VVDHFSPEPLSAGKPGRSLCITCHADGAGRHQNEPSLVHMVTSAMTGSLSLVPHSRECASCHDGAAAPDAHVRFAGAPRPRNGLMPINGGRDSHPVGVRYADARSVRPGSYRSVSDLPAEMLFENGAIGCATCHDLYSSESERLLMSNRGSVLCLTCHALTPAPPARQENMTFAALQSYFRQTGE